MIQNLLQGVPHRQKSYIHWHIFRLPFSELPRFLSVGTIEPTGDHATAAFALLILSVPEAAAGTGIYAGPSVILAPSVRGYLLDKHEKLMISALCVSAIMAIWTIITSPSPRKGRASFVLLLFPLFGAMSVGAHYGAYMVYGNDAGGHARPQPIGFVKRRFAPCK